MIKDRILDIMESSLECYSKERIEKYIKSVEEKGLTEHGFPRLGANLGFLIINGRKQELKDYFYKIMDICCEQIPKVKAANEFSIREIALLIIMADRLSAIEKEKLLEWKKKLSLSSPFDLYKKVYTLGGRLNNWAVFAAVSEWMRVFLSIKGDSDFVDKQIETQLEWFDKDGFYLEPHEPMVYDVVTRLLFCQIIHFGYNGKYKEFLDEKLKTAGIETLKTISCNAETPFGGRSNQFIYTEAVYVAIFMHEAERYKKLNNNELAKKFRKASVIMLDRVKENLTFYKGRHIKNFYESDSKIGCETYAYFDKYMITVASYLQLALFYSIEDIKEDETPFTSEKYVYQTSKQFHKAFLSNGEYSLQVDLDADYNYDASGLGRIHKKGAPDAICLSVPFAKKPNYKLEKVNDMPFSICPVIEKDNNLIFGAEEGAKYKLIKQIVREEKVEARFICTYPSKKRVNFNLLIDNDGVTITCKKLFSKVGIAFPVFAFDGENKTTIINNEDGVIVKYKGYICKYLSNGIKDLSKTISNRNGEYFAYALLGKNKAELKITIEKED